MLKETDFDEILASEIVISSICFCAYSKIKIGLEMNTSQLGWLF